MELSNRRVFRLRIPISLQWTRRYKAGYDLLDSTSDGYDDTIKPNRRRSASRTFRLGHGRKKGLFIAGISRRFRVRILRVHSYSWRLLLKRLRAFYLRLGAELTEVAPALEMVMNSLPMYQYSF